MGSITSKHNIFKRLHASIVLVTHTYVYTLPNWSTGVYASELSGGTTSSSS